MGILLDVGALSCRLGNKQLTARLIPIPGLKAGDQTQFESEYMCNGPVLRVRAVEEVSDGEIIDDVIPLESLLSLPHYV